MIEFVTEAVAMALIVGVGSFIGTRVAIGRFGILKHELPELLHEHDEKRKYIAAIREGMRENRER